MYVPLRIIATFCLRLLVAFMARAPRATPPPNTCTPPFPATSSRALPANCRVGRHLHLPPLTNSPDRDCRVCGNGEGGASGGEGGVGRKWGIATRLQ